MSVLRYDPEEDVSRHAATDFKKCKDMERHYGWKLKDVERLRVSPDSIFKVDCVFEGNVDFPPGGIGLSLGEQDND